MKAQGVTQVQLVAKTGLTPRTVNLLLSGKHNFKVSSLDAIAEVLGLQLTLSKRARANAKSAPSASPAKLAPTPHVVLPLLSYAPGARVVEHQIRRMGGSMPPDQALALWAEVQVALLKAGSESTVVEALESTTGSLDTAPREEVHDALGTLLVGRPWPANMDGRNSFGEFIAELSTALAARGALALVDPVELPLKG